MNSQSDRLNGLADFLKSQICGQDYQIDRICDVLIRGELGICDNKRPKGSFLFVGPTGVGKTEVTLLFTEYLFNSGDYFSIIDMGNFQHEDSVERFLGEEFLGKALRKGRGTICFDEMEKAHVKILDVFLSLLDHGRVRLANGETLSAADFYIVFTSNIGAADAMRMRAGSFSTMERAVLAQVLDNLRPEFVARINEQVVFSRLDFEVQRQIAEMMVSRELQRMKDRGYFIEITNEAIEFLIRKGFHKFLGARPVRDAVSRFMGAAIAHDILKGGDGSGRLLVDQLQEKLFILREVPQPASC